MDAFIGNLARQAVKGREKPEVLPAGEPPVEAPLSGADEPYQLFDHMLLLDDIVAENLCRPRGRQDQATKQLYQGCFTSPIRPPQAKKLPFLYFDADCFLRPRPL